MASFRFSKTWTTSGVGMAKWNICVEATRTFLRHECHGIFTRWSIYCHRRWWWKGLLCLFLIPFFCYIMPYSSTIRTCYIVEKDQFLFPDDWRGILLEKQIKIDQNKNLLIASKNLSFFIIVSVWITIWPSLEVKCFIAKKEHVFKFKRRNTIVWSLG